MWLCHTDLVCYRPMSPSLRSRCHGAGTLPGDMQGQALGISQHPHRWRRLPATRSAAARSAACPRASAPRPASWPCAPGRPCAPPQLRAPTQLSGQAGSRPAHAEGHLQADAVQCSLNPSRTWKAARPLLWRPLLAVAKRGSSNMDCMTLLEQRRISAQAHDDMPRF